MAGRIPTERSFGLSVGAAAMVFAALLTWRSHRQAGAVVAVIGIALVCGGLLAPRALRLPNRVWWRFAGALGWFNSRVLLTILFFLVLTPAGCLMRLFGRSPLRSVRADTNWAPYDHRRRDSAHYKHLY
jgi:hypothetical protein